MTPDENYMTELKVEEINHLSDQEQCDKIAEEFSYVQNEYSQLKTDDIKIPPFTINEIPQFTEAQVWKILSTLKTNKSSIEGDVPAKIFKIFAAFFLRTLDQYNKLRPHYWSVPQHMEM